MPNFSDQQKGVIDAPLSATSVIACAGSGKTLTAVERLAKVRELLGESRSHVALLSFSNVAVNTFRNEFLGSPRMLMNKRVTIETFDSFITSLILRPHAYRTMGCDRIPFLLNGSETFLRNSKCKYWFELPNSKKACVEGSELNKIFVQCRGGRFEFSYRNNDQEWLTNNGYHVTKYLGALGAYTHELGKYWAVATLLDQPEILRILSKRYSHIIVDEAQDVGELHQYVLDLLAETGVKITLIGDPNQAIYEFAGATGEYLKSFDSDSGTQSYTLSINYRSIPEILNVANELSSRKDTSDSVCDNDEYGAFYTVYEPNNKIQIVESFISKIQKTGLSIDNSAILCRSNSGVDKLRGSNVEFGQGMTKLFALATVKRDVDGNYKAAFDLVVRCVIGLLERTPDNLKAMIDKVGEYPEMRGLRQELWMFVRSNERGLPPGSLNAKADWHPKLKSRLVDLLDKIENKYGFSKTRTLGNKVSVKGLPEVPLIPETGLSLESGCPIRVDTVHQAKGESLDAVLYVASNPQIEEMLNGVGSEVGRIGYVAVTRAKKVFVLGVPKRSIKGLEARLKVLGLKSL